MRVTRRPRSRRLSMVSMRGVFARGGFWRGPFSRTKTSTPRIPLAAGGHRARSKRSVSRGPTASLIVSAMTPTTRANGCFGRGVDAGGSFAEPTHSAHPAGPAGPAGACSPSPSALGATGAMLSSQSGTFQPKSLVARVQNICCCSVVMRALYFLQKLVVPVSFCGEFGVERRSRELSA
jgi:hypothetical protein